jgi:hypothetical protein
MADAFDSPDTDSGQVSGLALARLKQAWPERFRSDEQRGVGPTQRAGLGGAGLPPAGFVVDKPAFDPDEFLKSKASLPDAPWAKNQAGMFDDLLPDAPWASSAPHDPYGIQSSTRQWAKEVTAPPPQRPQGYTAIAGRGARTRCD